MASQKVWAAVALSMAMFLLAGPAFGQQTYVTRFDALVGYSYFNSPAIGLPEHGVQFQFGVRPTTWYSLGFDYSNASGDMMLKPDLLPTALQQQLGAELGQLVALGKIPPTYVLAVPAHSETQTFAIGPQLAYRHFQHFTLFARPSIGAIREAATPKPTDAIAQAIATQLVPSGRKVDWTGFYGFAAGTDLLFSKHVGLRIQGDIVYDHMFNDILRNGRYTARIGIGPCFNFGKNIAE